MDLNDKPAIIEADGSIYTNERDNVGGTPTPTGMHPLVRFPNRTQDKYLSAIWTTMPNSSLKPPIESRNETDIAEYFNHIQRILGEIPEAETRADLATKVTELSEAITATRFFVAMKIDDYIDLNKRLIKLEKKIKKQSIREDMVDLKNRSKNATE